MKKSESACSEVVLSREDPVAIVLDADIASISDLSHALRAEDRAIFHREPGPTQLCCLVESHTRVVLVADFSHPAAPGWHFDSLAAHLPTLFPICVVGLTDHARDIDHVFNLVDTVPTSATPRELNDSLNGAMVTASARHRQWRRARQAVRIVRHTYDQSRRAQGKDPIADPVWDRACLTLCRASLTYGDDWETAALDLLIYIFKDEM
ncbi:MAG: hypothetical protein FJ146_07415 [Deltaproteobacteria bacterium]|nr:hypothetical protein [Deltaproteobacteria bacterium]